MENDEWEVVKWFPLLRNNSTLSSSYSLNAKEIPFILNKRVIFLGTSTGWRYEYFTKSLQESHPDWSVQLVEYDSFLKSKNILTDILKKGDIFRIETPEMNFEVDKQIFVRGFPYVKEEGYWCLSSEEINALQFDKGRILPFRQWYLGYCDVLNTVSTQLANCPPHALFLFPHEIIRTFDKTYCNNLFTHNNVPTPQLLPKFREYDALISYLYKNHIERVFVKPQNGSSASGIIILQVHSRTNQFSAQSTVEMDKKRDETRFYNNKKLQFYNKSEDVEEVVNFVFQNNGHIEKGFPKARLDDKLFDLRIVVIAGAAQHTAVRLSYHPLTNLHLTNMRGDLQDVYAILGEERWNTIKNSCKKAAGLFSNAFYSGLDVGISPDMSSHTFFEINAFGDLLKRIKFDGMDTYSSEIREIERSHMQ